MIVNLKSNRANISPTNEFYGALTDIFEHFNTELFDGSLPKCLITVQRKENSMGHFSANRWGNSEGKTVHEISLNPTYFANYKVIDIFQTLAHEQVHLWQFIFGERSRPGYHNKEWSQKMETIGLMPSHNGQPGGKKTGQKMSDYPISNGMFIYSCKKLLSDGYKLSWIDRVAAPAQVRGMEDNNVDNQVESILYQSVADVIKNLELSSPITQAKRIKSKIKYHCDSCNSNTWGKPGLVIICGKCSRFEKNTKIIYFNKCDGIPIQIA